MPLDNIASAITALLIPHSGDALVHDCVDSVCTCRSQLKHALDACGLYFRFHPVWTQAGICSAPPHSAVVLALAKRVHANLPVPSLGYATNGEFVSELRGWRSYWSRRRSDFATKPSELVARLHTLHQLLAPVAPVLPTAEIDESDAHTDDEDSSSSSSDADSDPGDPRVEEAGVTSTSRVAHEVDNVCDDLVVSALLANQKLSAVAAGMVMGTCARALELV
jgi:hypothetical protein